MAAMDKFKALVERSGSSDSQDTWISIKKDVNDLQKEIQLDLRKCKAKLIETLYELKAMTAELKKREDEIKTLNDGIRILEDTITELNAKARKYDRNADELESQANIKSKQAWAGVASGLFGILLAPATGGISLVATVAGGGFAVNGFVEAKEKRNKAEEARSDARDKIELVQEKKKKLAQDQEEITIMSADKQRYQDVIDARQKVIADLENLRNNISTYLFLIEYKINSSQKPLTR
ncbi:uncharacterized protein LOC127859797 [Dreissena polymorpha]|uniref:uncharacterized protein LOC127859797 n=1 Tax=Dreissena polymorpha TaxID=45954 RepID=UPI002264C51A|nr:uncharacterized protein LOC127859797 [Dreissena polymorpha]